MTGYLDIFSRSPFSPLQRHMSDVMACVEQLAPFADAMLTSQLDAAKTIQDKISQLERHADKQQREVMRRLPRGVFTPVARQDLLDMLNLQSEIAYKMDDIAGRLTSRPVRLEGQLSAALDSAFREYITRLLALARHAQRAVDEMDELLTTGFSGREAERVHDILDQLYDAEVACRKQLRQLRGEIGQSEQTLPPLEVVYLYRVSDRLAELQHLLKRHGNQFSLLMAKA